MNVDASVLLELSSVSLFLNDVFILADISLKVIKGQILTIIGPNGSGKTSLLQIIGGVNKSFKGTRGVHSHYKSAYLPQMVAVNRLLPISVCSFLKLLYKGGNDWFGNVIFMVEIQDILNKDLAKISTGELQRVMLARCVLTEADLLILDEPVSSMDIHARASFYNLVKKMKNDMNISIIMTSHDLNMVMKNTDKVICLNKRIHCQGSPDQVNAFSDVYNFLYNDIVPYRHK